MALEYIAMQGVSDICTNLALACQILSQVEVAYLFCILPAA
jgi:hypothetical protein